MPFLTEKQAWKYIGDCFYTPRGMRTDRQDDLVYCVGICMAVLVLCEGGRIATTTKFSMHGNIQNDSAINIDPTGDFYAYFCSPYPRSNDLLRADFCYLQYYMLGGV